MASMSATHLSRLKPLRGSITTALNPVLFEGNSSLGNALFSPTSSPNKSKFGSKIEGILFTVNFFFFNLLSFLSMVKGLSLVVSQEWLGKRRGNSLCIILPS